MAKELALIAKRVIERGFSEYLSRGRNGRITLLLRSDLEQVNMTDISASRTKMVHFNTARFFVFRYWYRLLIKRNSETMVISTSLKE